MAAGLGCNHANSEGPLQALVGLLLLGIGLGNLYPTGTSVTIALAPGQSVIAS